MPDLSKRLDDVLKPILEDDFESRKNLPPVKLQGKKETSAEGAHRFDKPVKFTELKAKPEFEDKKHEQSEQARPDLPKKSSV